MTVVIDSVPNKEFAMRALRSNAYGALTTDNVELVDLRARRRRGRVRHAGRRGRTGTVLFSFDEGVS